ncbi:SpoIID/LytB domain-containing protein [Mobilitalea sibirica]|uniref:SpoIID/LytB domain-containing protein n=1 Tax=Mobilitalea sibirica TaxID=1462919 RepID=A0A8J7H1K9_9FIRM|nr:SpoIID/LytB domain-containing protein [Mobilitalea sibirica]MBH1940318.1 SpoIID/LytB domain-containing protein [Mobilitalea sibirica]
MSIKRKLILIGVCIAIIILVFTANVFRRLKSEQDVEDIVVKENVISRAEAYRLLSYLEYDRSDRETLSLGISYADKHMSGWYDTYVNAVWKMGLIEGNITITPKEALTYGACKALVDGLIMKNPSYQNIYTGLSFDFMQAEEEMRIPEFLELYQAILLATAPEKKLVEEELLFVLGRDISDDNRDRIVTDLGLYFYQNSKDYEVFFTQMNQMNTNDENSVNQEASITPRVSDKLLVKQVSDHLNEYIDKGIHVLTCGPEIVYISAVSMEKHVIHNVWIKQGKDKNVETYIHGFDKSFEAKSRLSTDIEKTVGDITIENKKIVQISVKPDLIKGKVLMTEDDFIEVEGYGRVPLDEHFRIYKLYGELSMEPTSSILVGYETTDFVVSGGKISAALIRESIKAENIRILLHTTGFNDIYHESVEFTSNTEFQVSNNEEEKIYEAGETVKIEPDNELLADGRIMIEPTLESGKIQILSIERSSGIPKYRGRIEIAKGDNGLLVVNELPLEEYLYAVVPSEMPTYYGLEPLKVQAVCARSYAYKHLLANSLSSYGAHADDSVDFQVYNNIAENEDSILAVKDTYGKVIEYKGDIITAYYFSTSCGHTTGIEYVWADGVETPYLRGRLMAVEEDSEGVISLAEEEKIYQDLSKEDNFRSFIADKNFTTFDSGFNWYRWHVTIDVEDIKSTIDKKLAARYNANPRLIQTLVSGSVEEGNAVFESLPVDTLGDIVDISVLSRKTGGIVHELLITGTKNTIKVRTEYNIRALISPVNDTVYRLDESGVDNLNLLPSAFFIIDKTQEDNRLENVTITGGGYGHGVGMSQNGVKALSDAGRKYDEILTYFYEGTEMGFIYE